MNENIEQNTFERHDDEKIELAIGHIQSLIFKNVDFDNAVMRVAHHYKIDPKVLYNEYFAWEREQQDNNPQWVDTSEQGLQESQWNSKNSKKTSRAVKGRTEVIVRHHKPVDETYAGSRSLRKNIKAIFIQNKDGERFKYPFIHPAGAFAMAQHVDHGGAPHDPAGRAIIRMSEQIAQLQEFQKTVQHQTLHDDATGITERAVGRLNELKALIRALGKRHHYESWAAELNETEPPLDLSELDEITLEDYKSKFTQTDFNETLAQYFPLIHSIMQETNKIDLEEYVKETDEETESYNEESINHFGEFEEWAEAVEQGKLTDDQIEAMKQAFVDLEQGGQTLQLGPDGQTAWQFFNQLGIEDTDLEDKLKSAADVDANADPMVVFQKWAEENYPELPVALGISGTGQAPQSAEQPAAEPQPAAQQQGQPIGTQENDEGDWGAGASPGVEDPQGQRSVVGEIAEIVSQYYNRTNEAVGPFISEERVALEVKKQIGEKYGEQMGERAEHIALKFMEKMTHQWEQRHGKRVEELAPHDEESHGLERLKELIGRIKGRIEEVQGETTNRMGDTAPGEPPFPAFKENDRDEEPGDPTDYSGEHPDSNDDKDEDEPDQFESMKKLAGLI